MLPAMLCRITQSNTRTIPYYLPIVRIPSITLLGQKNMAHFDKLFNVNKANIAFSPKSEDTILLFFNENILLVY